ncbi:MAG: hypothetical protein EHM46_04790 [Bacteroidetes bacterium]|nr:MAG: hypothetical protein EHM46_04790 [Bacteroidota bacterium]
MEKNGSYMVVVSETVKDRAGTKLGQEKAVNFKVAAQPVSMKEPGKNPEKVTRTEYPDWAPKNLDVAFFRNGDPIPEARTNAEWEKTGREGKPSWCHYENDPEHGEKYGKLYNWYAVNDPRGLAPEGWHVASDAEWRQTTDFRGGEDAAGTRMKSSTGWNGKGNGINDSGFTGLPAGCRDLNGNFGGIGDRAFWWTTTEYDNTLAWYRCIDASPYYVYRTNYYKQNGLSVRCIRDRNPSP